MSNFNATIWTGPIVCSRESFAELVRTIADACGAEGSKFAVTLKLKKEIQVSGSYTVDELVDLAELGDARSLRIQISPPTTVPKVAIYFREGLVSVRAFTVDAPSREELDKLCELVKREAKARKPWWGLLGSVPVRLLSVVLMIAGIGLTFVAAYGAALLFLFASLVLSTASLFLPSFKIGEGKAHIAGATAMKWFANSVASGFIGAAIAKWLETL